MYDMEKMDDYNYRDGMDYRNGMNYRDGMNYRNFRDDYGRNRRNYRYYRSYREQKDEYAMMLGDIVDDSMELARAYEDVSEMATNTTEKQKLMRMAEREKEQYRMVKEMLESHM